jgi:hypothetical protein
MSLYPQKWHLPEGELSEGDFHRVRSSELVDGHFYYVHAEYPPYGKGKSKSAGLPTEYDLVGQYIYEDDSWLSPLPGPKLRKLKILYKRVKGKKWVAKEDEEASFSDNVIDAEDSSPVKEFFYMQTPPKHVPGAASSTYPSPGTYHYNWMEFMNAQRKREGTMRFTTKQPNRFSKSKSKSRKTRKTRKNRK